MTKQKIKKILKRLLQAVLIALLVLVFAFVVYTSYRDKTKIDVLENLDALAVTVDGEEMTLADIGFYILYEERIIEEEAEIYNADSTKDFWNIHVNGIFIQSQAKKTALGMAVHDRIFYRKAVEEGIVLTSEEKQTLEDARTDFWADLYDEQKENLPGTYDTINETMKEIALAEKYQKILANEMQTTHAGLNWNGYDYERLLEEEHEVVINKKIWNRVVLGDITISHTSVSYINGQTNRDKEEAK